ncbi:hypothetical protein AHAS_Ahas20G0274500 [Arachis hypogaea]|uniref:Uncharacterized protein n=1 Tax=Arachis hypogaea TaxID=3818 RepID=A0A444X6Y8_ARAHY|nr:hypothetical protein Ahy_B10g104995 [Arachis hypogaea]
MVTTYMTIWGVIVDRYEEMIENYHPFIGVLWITCGKFGNYSVERYLRQMNRAYNFNDNHILHMYGRVDIHT